LLIADFEYLIKNAIEVDTRDYSTGFERIYAIRRYQLLTQVIEIVLLWGDFHEASNHDCIPLSNTYPDQKLSFKYKTVNGVQCIF